MRKSFADRISAHSIGIEKIVYWIVALYVLDVAILGTGDLTKVGGISTRMIFWGLAMVLAIPLYIQKRREIWANKGALLMVLFLGMVAVSAGIGLLNKNNISLLLGDIKGFMNILIVFPMICVMNSKERIIRLMRILLWAMLILFGVCVFLSYLEMYSSPLDTILYKFINKEGIGILTGITTRSARVFLYSPSRMAGFGILMAFVIWAMEKKHTALRFAQMVACLGLIFFSYGRALYLAIVIVVVLFLVAIVFLHREHLKATIKAYVGVVLVTVVVVAAVGLSQQTNLFKAAIDRCLVAVMSDTILYPHIADSVDMNIGNLEAEVESIELREDRVETATQNFLGSPIIGNGLGVSNDSENGTIEYFYQDLLSKMGIVGLILFLLPAIWILYLLIGRRKSYCQEQSLLLLASWMGLLFLMVISYFNPCMNTAWGLMVYGFTAAISVPWKKTLVGVNEYE